jgi:hypothetical protein
MTEQEFKPPPGTVFFGCEQVNDLYTPFIQVTTHAGKTIRLMADCGVDNLADGKRFCEFLFGILSQPKDVVFHPDDKDVN